MPSGTSKIKAIQFMDAMRGSPKPVLRCVRAREVSAKTRPGRWPREVKQCWHSARKGPERLQREGSLLEGVAMLPEKTLCSGKELLMETLEAAVPTRAKAEEQARVKA